MLKRIGFEIKQLLTSKIIFLLFVLVMICTYFHNQTLNTYHENQLELINAEFESSKMDYTLMSYLSTVSTDDESLYFYTLNEYHNIAVSALENNDMQEYKKTKVFLDILMLIPAENFYKMLDPIMISSYERYFTLYDDVQKIKEEINFDEEINYISNSRSSNYDQRVNWGLKFDYNYYLSKAVPVATTLQSSPLAFVEYARDFHYISFVICAIFVTSYSLYVDNKDGVLKTILIADGQRVSYILVKIISCTIVVSLISLIAPLLVIIYKCGIGFFSSLDIPILKYDKSLNSFKPFLRGENELQYSSVANNIVATIRMRANFLTSEIQKSTYDAVIAMRQLIQVPLHFYLSFISIFTAVFISFLSSLTIFFTSLLKKRISGIAMTVSLVMGLFALSKFTAYDAMISYFNPFTYTNIPALIEGSIPYTYLMGILCLGGYTILLIIGSLFAFRKKDI